MVPVISFSREKQARPDNELKAFASFSLNSNGLNPIPAFSLGKPALIASVNLVKSRFSFDPALAYNLEMKPWYFDNWLHYRIIVRPKFELKAGANFSTFISGVKVNDDEILKAERYFTFSMAGTYRFTPVSTLTLDYWNDNGQEKGSLTGHFIYLAYDRSEIDIGERAFFSVNLMLFYINYTDNNDGLFVSPKVSLSMKNNPVSLFFQATQAIESNITPWPGFEWNVGISYNPGLDFPRKPKPEVIY